MASEDDDLVGPMDIPGLMTEAPSERDRGIRGARARPDEQVEAEAFTGAEDVMFSGYEEGQLGRSSPQSREGAKPPSPVPPAFMLHPRLEDAGIETTDQPGGDAYTPHDPWLRDNFSPVDAYHGDKSRWHDLWDRGEWHPDEERGSATQAWWSMPYWAREAYQEGSLGAVEPEMVPLAIGQPEVARGREVAAVAGLGLIGLGLAFMAR